MTQNVWGRPFQLSCQILEFFAAFDVSLTLGFCTQVLCCGLSQLLYSSLGDPLGDSYPHWLPFCRHRDANQQPLPFLVTADGRQSFWTTNNLYNRPLGAQTYLEDNYVPWWQGRVAHPILDYDASKLAVGAVRLDSAIDAGEVWPSAI